MTLPRVEVTVDWNVDHVPAAIDAAEAASLLQHALEKEGRSGTWEVAVRFVADAEMRALHEAFLDDPAVTDIMTFPYDPEEGAPGADILLCVDAAAEHARQHGWTLSDELRFLILHGLLHIVGWKDRDDAAREAMLDRQHELLESWLPGEAL
jgi:rRNA maturation RNase YbeY